MARPRTLVLMGPTAAGKTRLALELAEKLDGEIISVDASLVYRGMDIGTAKPTLAERAHIPHHLIDILDPSEAYSTGRFRNDALRLIREIHTRGRLPLLVGGTMLYFNALLHGLAELPPAAPEIRAQLDNERLHYGLAALHDELLRVDPESARRIHPNDPQRIQRALEVYRSTGIPLTAWRDRQTPQQLDFIPWTCVLAPAARSDLDPLIRERFLLMLELGLEEEARQLYSRKDLHPDLPALRTVGYRQLKAYFDGRIDYAGMIDQAVIATRQFAKRQYTWLRREADTPHFLTGSADLASRVLAAFSA